MLNKNEKKILLSIKVLPILIIIILSAVVTYLFTVQNQTRFDNEIKVFREDFIKTNKLNIKFQVEKMAQTIKIERKDALENLKSQAKHEVENAHSIATRVFEQNKNLDKRYLQKLIEDILKDTRHENNSNYLYTSASKTLKINKINTNHNEIVYEKRFEQYGWIIGSVIDIDNYELLLKEKILNKLKNVIFEENKYYFILDETGAIITKNINQVEVSQQTFNTIKKTLNNSNNDSGFINYNVLVKKENKSKEKISYIKKIKDYNWIIGYGFYPEDINKQIKIKQLALEEENNSIKRRMFFINVFVTFFLVVTLIFFSDFVKQQFIIYRNKNQEYQDRLHSLIDEKTIRLQKLNKSLEEKVKTEVKKNRNKDKIMFQQSKMAAMGELLAMIAHQWRQPLAQINSITLNMYSTYKKGDFTIDVLKKDIIEIENTTKFLSQTITDFSTFFRPEKEKHTFSTKQAIDECLHLLFPKFIHKVNINVNVKNDSNIHGYVTQYQQSVLTILINALDMFEERHIESPNINIEIDSIDGKSILTITDNAQGIKKDSLDKIFEAYYSTKKNKKNSGLGLHISKMIIEQTMNGKITVQNTEDGAQFTIII